MPGRSSPAFILRYSFPPCQSFAPPNSRRRREFSLSLPPRPVKRPLHGARRSSFCFMTLQKRPPLHRARRSSVNSIIQRLLCGGAATSVFSCVHIAKSPLLGGAGFRLYGCSAGGRPLRQAFSTALSCPAGALRMFMNSSPVMVSFFSRYSASSCSLPSLALRMFTAFSWAVLTIWRTS